MYTHIDIFYVVIDNDIDLLFHLLSQFLALSLCIFAMRALASLVSHCLHQQQPGNGTKRSKEISLLVCIDY
jgi:hypothetical protein